MRVRWLGWAGFEIEADGGGAVVIDPLADPGATFAPLGESAGRVELPEVVAPEARGARSRAWSATCTATTRTPARSRMPWRMGAAVHEPAWPGGEDVENLALAQANAELERADLSRRPVEPWERVEAGPFALTALPAVDGLGDPQVSWLVEADGQRALHLGDTMFHGYWWRMARRHGPFDVVFAPVNGAVIDFPHLQPPSPLAAAMEPEQAALACELLGARAVVPMHYGGYAIEPWYRPIADAAERFAAAAAGRTYDALTLKPGESIEFTDPAVAAAG